MDLLDRLKRRKLFQWALAYVAAGWLVMQVVENLGGQFLWPLGIQRGITVVLGLGFPIVLVLAWYHGEKGRQRVSGPEFVILTSLILLAGVALTVFNPLEEIEPVSVEAVVTAVHPYSIAVLPFVDMSENGDQEYMSDGIAEELLNLLQRIPELEVKSRTSAFSFKGRTDITVPEIAADLGVAHVLEGSVRMAGNTIRVTAQLIDGRTDAHLFSTTYDRELDSIFVIQDEIAAKVVSELKMTLLGELPTLQETDPQAYTLFLEARHIADTNSEENYETTIPMFERVLEIDPDYAPAHLELANAYGDQGANGWRPYAEGLQMAMDAAARALSLDPDFAYARAVLGSYILRSGDPAGGARAIERALEMDPDHPEILMIEGLLLLDLGRVEEGIPLLEYVRDRDPKYPVNLSNLSYLYLVAGRSEEAAGASRALLELNPDHPFARVILASALLQLGQAEEALAVAESDPIPFFRLSLEALANFDLGRLSDLETAFGELRASWSDAMPSLVPMVYAYTGDADSAFEWLDRVSRESAQAPLLTFHPAFAPLHDDPRWAAYRERMGQSQEMLDAVSFEVRAPR